LDISGHDSNSFGVDCAEVSVLEKSNEIGFRGFLESENRGGLESELAVEFVSDFSDESLERKLSKEEVGGLLISSDFSEGDCTGSESVWSLDTSLGWGGFSCSLSGKGFFGSFSGGGFSRSLFSSGHCFVEGLLGKI